LFELDPSEPVDDDDGGPEYTCIMSVVVDLDVSDSGPYVSGSGPDFSGSGPDVSGSG